MVTAYNPRTQDTEAGNLKSMMKIIITVLGTGEMVQWLRALPVLPEDPGSNPSTYMAAQLSISPRFDTFIQTYM